MKKHSLFFIPVIFYVLLLSTCASVKSQGINFFIGRTENDLNKHFGYNGVEMENSRQEYDKILFFTNKVMRYQMSKTNVVRYKISRQTEILSFTYYEFPDGCIYDSNSHYDSITNQHKSNQNSLIVPRINEFYRIINNNIAFPNTQRTTVFNNSKIGDVYYLYFIDKNILRSGTITRFSGSGGGAEVIRPGEIYTANTLILWKIDIVADDRAETERLIVVRYNERLDRCFDGNGNVISLERANSILSYYVNNGFTQRILTEGHSLIAYIKNDNIIKVEKPQE